MYWTDVENIKQAEYWIVGDDNIFMQSCKSESDSEIELTYLTQKQEMAKKFNNIGDAMRGAVSLNKLGWANRFRVIPIYE